MKVKTLGTFFLVAMSLSILPARADEKGEVTTPSPTESSISTYELLNFRAAPLAVIQSAGSSYSFLLSWNPEWRLNDQFSAGLNLGGTVIQNTASTSFFAMEYQLTGSYQFIPNFFAELGAGAQTWTSVGSTYLLLSGTAYYQFPKDNRPFKILDKVFAGYSSCFVSAHYASEIKIGAGVSF